MPGIANKQLKCSILQQSFIHVRVCNFSFFNLMLVVVNNMLLTKGLATLILFSHGKVNIF